MALAATVLSGCSALRPQQEPEPEISAPASPPRDASQVIARNDRFLIYLPGTGDTLASVARRFLGTEQRQWLIAEFNGITRIQAGQAVVVPLQATNPAGVQANGYQTVPILCYHRFSASPGKMSVSPASFAAQLDYLARNDYHVLRLSELVAFLEGTQPLPRRAVVITIDDGYASTYQHAFPLLKKYGFPATLFLYTDFLGAKDAVSWPQLQEMVASGLVDVQAHSKTHANLSQRLPGESDERYRERLDTEIRVPREVIQGRLPVRVSSYAYPYGDANDEVIDGLARADYRIGVTVNPGGNPAFSHPLLLRRTMIFGEHDLEAFKAKLQVFREMDLR
jgi:peptidoglycan/xylan/chitin deacetylase (PgdA/CDA1 family)